MGKLGISIYPERSTSEKDKAYLDLAHRHGFKRVFTSLLQVNDGREKVLIEFKKVVGCANQLGMEVMVDTSPVLFEQLGISHGDLSSLRDVGAYGIYLDPSFTRQEEVNMTRNPYDTKTEINTGSGTNYIDNIMAYSPNIESLLGSHNFYPHHHTGLGYEYFTHCLEKFRKYNLNMMTFVNLHDATSRPWPT